LIWLNVIDYLRFADAPPPVVRVLIKNLNAVHVVWICEHFF
jgi:hypothetical protein